MDVENDLLHPLPVAKVGPKSFDRSKGTKRQEARPVFNPLPLPEWFDHAGVTARQVSEAIGIGESHLSNIAGGKRPYLRPHLEAIAAFLSGKLGRTVFPSQLLHPPGEEPLQVTISRLPERERRRISAIVAAFEQDAANEK